MLYSRLLRVVAGKEPASEGEEPTTKYQFLLPYFVLGGMAGMRTCELVRSSGFLSFTTVPPKALRSFDVVKYVSEDHEQWLSRPFPLTFG